MVKFRQSYEEAKDFLDAPDDFDSSTLLGDTPISALHDLYVNHINEVVVKEIFLMNR